MESEIARRLRIAARRFEEEVRQPIDHLDDRNVNRWLAERHRITQRVRREHHKANQRLARRVGLDRI